MRYAVVWVAVITLAKQNFVGTEIILFAVVPMFPKLRAASGSKTVCSHFPRAATMQLPKIWQQNNKQCTFMGLLRKTLRYEGLRLEYSDHGQLSK